MPLDPKKLEECRRIARAELPAIHGALVQQLIDEVERLRGEVVPVRDGNEPPKWVQITVRAETAEERHRIAERIRDLEAKQWPAVESYDPVADVATIHGVKYSGELFRHLGLGPVGSAIRIVSRDDGVVTLKKLDEV